MRLFPTVELFLYERDTVYVFSYKKNFLRTLKINIRAKNMLQTEAE